MKRMFCVAFLSLASLLTADDRPYDFRASESYQRLAAVDRQRLEQVRRDQVLLWGALDMYADEHNGNLPETLDGLTPKYLAELPSDPFATQLKEGGREIEGYTRSKGGVGYHLRRGAPGNRAWVIASVGLPDFPYLAEHGNVGLYVCKGLWISGINPAVGNAFKAEATVAPERAPAGPALKPTSPGQTRKQ